MCEESPVSMIDDVRNTIGTSPLRLALDSLYLLLLSQTNQFNAPQITPNSLLPALITYIF